MKYPENYIEISQYMEGINGPVVNPDWLEMRLGCVTGSKIYDVVTKRKRVKEGEEAKPLQTYLNCLDAAVYEIIQGRTAEKYVSYWMERGISCESLARNSYEIDYGYRVDTRIGFVLHPTIKMAGYSPDGLIDDDGLLEIKVPAPMTHWRYVCRGEIPEEYYPQMMWGLACTGRQWCDFYSHDPDARTFKDFRIRLHRDTEAIAAMEAEASKFLAEVDAAVQAFREKMKGAMRTQEETA